LTGEADALGYRILCDLTASGRQLVAECFGLTGPQAFPENWNHGSEAHPHVGCVMLAADSLHQIAPIALLKSGCHTVVVCRHGEQGVTYFGFEANEEFIHARYEWDREADRAVLVEKAQIIRDGVQMVWPYSCYGTPGRVFQPINQPRNGFRCVHAMSGRSD
jgi:hypothetical protein